MRDLRHRVVTPVTAAVLAGVALQLILPLLSTRLGLVIASVPIAIAGFLAPIGFLRQSRAHTGRQRAGWALGIVGSLLLGASYTLYTGYAAFGLEPGKPNLADLLSVGSATVALVGIALAAPPLPGAMAGTTHLIDVATVAGSLFALVWQFVIPPATATLPLGNQLTFVLTLLPEIIAAALALTLMSRIQASADGRALHLLAAALALFALAAVGSTHNSTRGAPWYATGVGALYLTGGLLVALASRSTVGAADSSGRRALAGFWTALPYVPVALAICAVSGLYLRTGTLSPVLVWALVSSTGLAMLRQFLSLLTIKRLLSDLDEQQERLRHAAHHDALTGLPNRTAFHGRAAEALAAAGPDDHTGVLLVDLDGFKPVNDQLGHAAGDAVLIAVGRRLPDALRGTDTAARLGGDEFAVLLPNLNDPGEAELIAARIIGRLAAPVPTTDTQVRVGASVGMTTARGAGHSIDRLLREADHALYAAKAAGKSVVRRFAAAPHPESPTLPQPRTSVTDQSQHTA
ncbi:diguanylate cyclase (GGDEF)-like protein [Krasilnikovia cinnamomea]|uniref:Diguanylate cyclase (GGDEF)-like protein n=1 Tax=Krasilnikovia cinnamomea TaxID=349313 RepID=A0A4Q7ZGY5_9ACTN|nr:GGDEF domain-containing protein [Krasilnikovia cinnamomea]RZU50080.1 diguanylate cyclase (GGDEF)-like protein [Krasilnikovia cinnamomea]